MIQLLKDPAFRAYLAARGGAGYFVLAGLLYLGVVGLGTAFVITGWAWCETGAIGLWFGWVLHREAWHALGYDPAGDDDE